MVESTTSVKLILENLHRYSKRETKPRYLVRVNPEAILPGDCRMLYLMANINSDTKYAGSL